MSAEQTSCSAETVWTHDVLLPETRSNAAGVELLRKLFFIFLIRTLRLLHNLLGEIEEGSSSEVPLWLQSCRGDAQEQEMMCRWLLLHTTWFIPGSNTYWWGRLLICVVCVAAVSQLVQTLVSLHLWGWCLKQTLVYFHVQLWGASVSVSISLLRYDGPLNNQSGL